MLWFILAGIAAALGALMLYLAKRADQRKGRLLAVETLSVADLRELNAAASGAAGAGAFSTAVELEGRAEAGPSGTLTAPVSDSACVWHRHQVTREYRERVKDSDGSTRTEKRTETVESGTSDSPFTLTDDTGSIAIRPSGNLAAARESVDRYEKAEGASISIGSITIPVSRDRETLGYRYQEWVLEEGQRIFVQGEATDSGHDLEVRDPAGKDKLVVSSKTEADLIADADASADRNVRIGLGLFAAAVVLAVVGVVAAVL